MLVRLRRPGEVALAASSEAARRLHASLGSYAPAPLRAADVIALRLGLAEVVLKDESAQLGLPSESVAAGSIVTLGHPQASMMVGLNCATPPPVAWPLVSRVAVNDVRVPGAVRLLATDGITAGYDGGTPQLERRHRTGTRPTAPGLFESAAAPHG